MSDLQTEVESRNMVSVGAWQLSKVVTDEWSQYNGTVPTDQHVEQLQTIQEGGNLWRHADGKTWLRVAYHPNGTFQEKWKVVVYKGSHETDSVGPGWTCGINAYCDTPAEAAEWAYAYMQENQDMSHLYDD